MSTPGHPPVSMVPFDPARLDATVECITQLWTADNVIARALGVTSQEYRPVARAVCEQVIADGLGLVLVEDATERIVGFCTAVDLVDELETIRRTLEVPGPPTRMARWARMLDLGMRWYLETFHTQRPPQRGEVIYFNIGGTLSQYRGQGWINRMTMTLTGQVVIPRGYQRVVAVATHAHSVNKVRNLKLATTLHELTFAQMDDPDLRRITEPPCAVVNVTPLRRGVARSEG